MTGKFSRWAALGALALLPVGQTEAAERTTRPAASAPSASTSGVRRTTTRGTDKTKATARRPVVPTSATTDAGSAARRAAGSGSSTVKAKTRSAPEAQLASATSRRVRTTRYQPVPPPDEELMPTDEPTPAADAPASKPKLKPIPTETYEESGGEIIYEDGGYYGDDCSSGCGDACGGSCGSCCDFGCGRGCGAFLAGFDFVFLQANFSDNPGFYSVQSNGQLVNQTDAQFVYNPKLSSRVWLGYEAASGLGTRARFFAFDQNSQNTSGTATFDTSIESPLNVQGFRAPSTTAAGDDFFASSGLIVKAVDLEGTKRACFGAWSILASGGFRYGLVKHTYNADIRSANGLLESTAQYGHRFEGFGPQMGVEARRRVTSNLSLFSSARVALLFGHGSSQATISEGLQNTVTNLTLSKSKRSDLLPIMELQIGGEYLTNYSLGAGRIFCRGALEAQLYQGAGSATSEEGDLALFGGSVSIGMTY